MNSTYDVIVVGAGYVGCSVAYYLSSAGLKVALVEQGMVAAGASRANYGNIQVQDAELQYSLPLVSEGFKKFDSLEEELGLPLQLRRIGCLLAIESEHQWKMMQERQNKVRTYGINSELLDADEVRKLEPNMNTSSMLGALYNPEEKQLYPFALMWAFIRRAREKGMVLMTNTEVTGFIVENGKMCGVVTTGGNLTSNSVVLTTGAWTKKLGEFLGKKWKIHHVHGQAVVTEPLKKILNNYVASAAFFEEAHEETEKPDIPPELNIPTLAPAPAVLAFTQLAHGNFLLGESSRVSDHYDYYTTPGAPAAVSKVAARYFPTLRNARVLRGWGSPVAFTEDGLPFLGPVKDIPGLILATAFRSTVISTPLTGEIVTQLITQGYSDLNISHFSPDR